MRHAQVYCAERCSALLQRRSDLVALRAHGRSLTRSLVLALSSSFLLASTAAWSDYYVVPAPGTESTLSDQDDATLQVDFAPGQTINLFGRTYNKLFVNTNGFITFDRPPEFNGSAHENLITRNGSPLIAVAWQDLDFSGFTEEGLQSNLYIDTSTPGQIIITWDHAAHYGQAFDSLTSAQLIVRSSQFAIPSGEGQIGFFYAGITDQRDEFTLAGFSNGNGADANGDLQFYEGPATGLERKEFWFAAPTVPVAPVYADDPVPSVPEPHVNALLACGLGALLWWTRRRSLERKHA